ncbi:hypothetical protein L873DRAFT_1842905 [Choiromyces venosus 120613-1]|uniref:Uncharacterized protein n=1 Tax=Choiromyces venosus 120613-1 TaxID=1336337 RepID=A0A3N4K458_9PEZI|nr:hypothetical protein L873DRAFT_1842905 [Choiromyces venosus 120613-1]
MFGVIFAFTLGFLNIVAAIARLTAISMSATTSTVAVWSAVECCTGRMVANGRKRDGGGGVGNNKEAEACVAGSNAAIGVRAPPEWLKMDKVTKTITIPQPQPQPQPLSSPSTIEIPLQHPPDDSISIIPSTASHSDTQVNFLQLNPTQSDESIPLALSRWDISDSGHMELGKRVDACAGSTGPGEVEHTI